MALNRLVKVRDEKFGAAVFDTLREKVFVTNETGAQILRLLNEDKRPDEIIECLERRYNEDGSLIRRDVTDFIKALMEVELLAEDADQGKR